MLQLSTPVNGTRVASEGLRSCVPFRGPRPFRERPLCRLRGDLRGPEDGARAPAREARAARRRPPAMMNQAGFMIADEARRSMGLFACEVYPEIRNLGEPKSAPAS